LIRAFWMGLRPAPSVALLAGYKNIAVVWASLGAAPRPI
jgi:hypothetical protein